MIEREVETHLLAQLLPDSILLVSFYDKMMIVEILDDEAFLFIHHQKDLFYCRITARFQDRVDNYMITKEYSDQMKRMPSKRCVLSVHCQHVERTFDGFHR